MGTRPIDFWRFLLALGTLTACAAKTPAGGPPAPAGPGIPPGCERSQAGDYHHADSPSFRYHGDDDGGTLVLRLLRSRPDGGVDVKPDASVASLVLCRTQQGFVGDTFGEGFSVGGHSCPVRFPSEVVRCEDGGLTI